MAVDTTSMGQAGIALGAGIAMAGGALGTAWAQASIGSSIMGVLAEKPEETFKLIIYMALPELIVLLGFVVSFLMVQQLGGTA
ncbi:MAG: ATPase [Candidatus Marsarchaeota archaeon]|nr:ATPase [Candidatus Marsarchaeota archaeon]